MITVQVERRTLGPLFLVFALSISATGCIYSREISRTRRVIEDEIPGSQFDRQMVLSIGSGTLRTATWLTSLIPDEDLDEVRQYLDDVERIKVGIYDTEALPEVGPGGAPGLSEMVERGWEVAVRVRDERDRVWLMYRSHRDRIRSLFVIVLNEDNLVIARVEGHLDRILERAMADYRPFSRLAHLRDGRKG